MKSDLVYLLHIQEFCNDIIEYIKYETDSFEDFKNNKMLVDAVIRKLEIIGEASNNISDDFKSKYSSIPFKEMKGIRNILIHEYFGVDYNIVYKTAIEEIPKLKKQIDELVERIKNG